MDRMKLLMAGCLTLLIGALTGCAPTDLVIKPTYQTTGESKGPGGQLTLVSALDGAKVGTERIQFIYGEIKDSDGKIKGNVTSAVSPASLVRDALQEELLKAGYTVPVAQLQAKDAEQAVVLTTATIALDETVSLVKSEAECKVSVAIELWKKGTMVRRLIYGKSVSDFALKDRDRLHQQLLQKALGAVMKDAVADVVTYLK